MEDSNGQCKREAGLTLARNATLALLGGLVVIVLLVTAVLMLIWL